MPKKNDEPQEKTFTMVKIDLETHARLHQLAALDRRFISSQFAWLVEEELIRRGLLERSEHAPVITR